MALGGACRNRRARARSAPDARRFWRAMAAGASRASSSMREVNFLSFDENPLEPEIAIQYDDVGPGLRTKPATVFEPEIARGVRRDAAGSLDEIQAEHVHEVAQRLVHGEGRAGERAVGEAH